MKKLVFQVFGSLSLVVILTIVNFEHWYFMILAIVSYALFKAMDLYYEYTN